MNEDDREGLRAEMRRGFAEVAATQEEMRLEFAEFAATQQEMRRGLEQVRHDLATTQDEMRRGFAETHARLDRVETEARHQGVLLEATRDDVRGIAEGHTLLAEQLERHREENTAAHVETRGLVRAAYRDLDRRVSRLEDRPDGQPPPP